MTVSTEITRPNKMPFQSKILQFRFTSEEVMVSHKELIRSIGYSEKTFPSHLNEYVHQGLETAGRHAQPMGGFVLLEEKKIVVEPDRLHINGLSLKSGRIITKHFRKVETLAVLLATIGNEPEIISKQMMHEGDLLKGYFVDAAASSIVEKTADAIEEKLQRMVGKEGLRTSNRYSPGYCGWNVEDQHKLFSFFPKGFCGVILNKSAMMIPMKSVSALTGIGANVQKEEYECEICDAKFCCRKNWLKRRHLNL